MVIFLCHTTPPKINGWNLEMMVSNRNLRDSKGPPFSGSMFVSGGAIFAYRSVISNIIHPGKLTWNLKMEVWKMIFLFKQVIFRFHVSFRGCIPFNHHEPRKDQPAHPTKITVGRPPLSAFLAALGHQRFSGGLIIWVFLQK